jgi:hypothetical protein
MFITGPALDDRPGCEAVLRSLPAWFGIEPALQHYVADSASLPGFALRERDGGAPIGFLSLRQHFPQARGFQPLEVFQTLWDPHNPALQLLKVLPTA